jgi:FtsP/CotA-like multicopper oxidase with cupredoxin domain
MNGVPLAETDKIKIEGGQVTRITLNNLTMMHHPMHLHGHFFRVINENGDYSPQAYRKCTSNGQCHHRVLRK